MEDYKKEIRDAVRSAVKEALSETCGVVKCPVIPEIAQSIGHFFGMVKDVGDGDHRRGVEEIRDCMRMAKSYRGLQKNIGVWLSRTAVVSIFAAVLLMIWQGFKQFINK